MDQLVHLPSGVWQMFTLADCIMRSASPLCCSGQGIFVRSISSPTHLFCLQGASLLSTMMGGCTGLFSMEWM